MTVTSTRPPRETVRAGILAAAEHAFLAHGYVRSSLSEIAAAAGFTKGAVYSNFGGKPELLSAVCAAHIEAIAASVIGTLSATDSIDLGARALADQLTGSSAWPELWVEFRGLAAHDEGVRAAYGELRSRLRGDLERQLRDNAERLTLPPDTDFAVAATLLLTVANGLALEHAAAPAAMPRELIERCLAQLIGGLR
ncbi:TetR/AcrR family transcriptional regulator [Microlunatus ginsengisoli]|uniref:TetR/AcrR family transcriptional regulator n=1 Tax=Microlunatus ginsengisoli TaxID=363863 RepID=A0ABP6ZK14_9ACTN